METIDKPIQNIEDAKSYFHSMGCSHFHMCREYPKRYNEYKTLNVSSEQELEWRKESLDQMASRLEEIEPKELWATHSSMENLVQELKTRNSLERIYEATKQIEKRLPPKGKLLVAETIIGRQNIEQRSGLIFLSSKLGEEAITVDLSKIAIRLLEEAEDRLSSDIERCRRASSRIKEIIKILKLKDV